jgi:ribosomal protein L14
MGVKKRAGHIGHFIVATVTKASPESPLKKGDRVRGYLVNSVYGRSRPSGLRVRFSTNGIVLVNKKREPLASRVLAALPQDLRRYGRTKRLSLSSHIV